MNPTKILAALMILLAGLSAGCQQRMAGLNPVGPVPVGIYPTPTPNPCPAIFSFESGGPTNWSTTSWSFGLTDLRLDSAFGYCGTHSVRVTGNWGSGGDRNGFIEYDFPGSPAHYDMTAKGTEIHYHVYTDIPLPTGSSIAIIVARAGTCGNFCWTSPYVGVTGNPPAATWFEVIADYGSFGYTGLNDVQQLMLNVYCGGTAPWNGHIWIDEVNW